MIAGVAALVVAPQILILTYHDIVPKRDQHSVWFDCSVSEFESQLEWLTRQGAKFSSLAGFAELKRHKVGNDRIVIITFADNYLGFYRYAMPILRRRHIPAAQFVHTGFVGSSIGRPKMTWKQIFELDREGLVTFGSQTVTHPADLRELSDSDLRSEFVKSKSALELKLRHPVSYLAYPNGKFDDRCAKFARDAGYSYAFTEELRPALLAKSDWLVGRYVHTKYRLGWRDISRRTR